MELISLQELVLLQAEEGVGEPGELEHLEERMKVSRTSGWSEGSKATTRLSQSRSEDGTGQDS